jgi:acyl dehydratase
MNVGDELFTRTFTVDRQRLVRYAGASGDLNPIHYDDAAATAAGLPGVIAHGMATMGLAGTALADWAGDPGAVLDYGVRFTRPVPVPGAGSAEVVVTGTVGALEEDVVRVDLTVRSGGVTVLARAQARVRRPA